MSILDSTVDHRECLYHHEVFEVDDKGNSPDSLNFNCSSEHSIELIMRQKKHCQVSTQNKLNNVTLTTINMTLYQGYH